MKTDLTGIHLVCVGAQSTRSIHRALSAPPFSETRCHRCVPKGSGPGVLRAQRAVLHPCRSIACIRLHLSALCCRKPPQQTTTGKVGGFAGTSGCRGGERTKPEFCKAPMPRCARSPLLPPPPPPPPPLLGSMMAKTGRTWRPTGVRTGLLCSAGMAVTPRKAPAQNPLAQPPKQLSPKEARLRTTSDSALLVVAYAPSVPLTVLSAVSAAVQP